MDKKQVTLRLGFGKREITPPMGTPLVGYYYSRVVKGVFDPLFIRAAMFETEEEKAILMTIDICLLSKDLSIEIRKLIAEKIGISADAILISASHTHTGPLTGKDFASNTWVDPSYLEFLKTKAVEASLEALEDLAPSRMFYAKTEAKGISFVRRYRMKDGSVKTNPKPLDPEIDYPLGEPNEELRLLKVERDGAKDVYFVNFGTHPDTVSGEYVSADWPGYVCSILENAIPESDCMLLLGPQGDVNHFNPFAPQRGIVGKIREKDDPKGNIAHARYMGRVIAGQILTICDRAEEISAGNICIGTLELALPTNRDTDRLEQAKQVYEEYLDAYEKGNHTSTHAKYGMSVPEARRIVRMQNEPDFYNYWIYAIRLGEFVFAGLPGEPFTEIGRRIYKASPFERMFITCQTNVSCGYIGTSQSYEEGGYETLASSYKKGADNVMVDGMLSLLEKI